MTALIVTLIVLVGIVAWFAMAVVTIRTFCGKDPEGLRYAYDETNVFIGFTFCCLLWPILLPAALIRAAVVRHEGEFIRLLDPRHAEREKRQETAAELHKRSVSMAELASTLTDDKEHAMVADAARSLHREARELNPRAYYSNVENLLVRRNR